MILLDTHIWVWKVSQPERLSSRHQGLLGSVAPQSFGVSIISCWEVAKLVEVGRLTLSCPVLAWIEQALANPGIDLVPITPRIAAESTELPGAFHRDPADQLLVATARVLACPLMSEDSKIARYPYVQHV